MISRTQQTENWTISKTMAWFPMVPQFLISRPLKCESGYLNAEVEAEERRHCVLLQHSVVALPLKAVFGEVL